jgi:hypothetical protein
MWWDNTLEISQVKNDPDRAEHYLREADKQEDIQAESHADEGADGVRVNEKSDGIITINAQGKITMTNDYVLKIFGYKKVNADHIIWFCVPACGVCQCVGGGCE